MIALSVKLGCARRKGTLPILGELEIVLANTDLHYDLEEVVAFTNGHFNLMCCGRLKVGLVAADTQSTLN